MRWICITFLIAVSGYGVAHAADASSKPIQLPFQIKQNLILIKGAVDSTSGDFMLDTGETYFRFLLNRHRVPLGRGSVLFKMHAASGQVSTIESHEGEHRIVLAGKFVTGAESGFRFHAEEVVSEDEMLKAIDPPLLGIVGYAFLKHYDFTIDYESRILSLYPIGSLPDRRAGIQIGFAPASPIVPFTLRIDGVNVPAYLDTGGWQQLKTSAHVWEHLASSAQVMPGSAGETGCVRILNVRYGAAEFDIPHVEKVVAQKTMLTLGFPFLRRYLSVWRPLEGTVTLIRKWDVKPLQPSSCD